MSQSSRPRQGSPGQPAPQTSPARPMPIANRPVPVQPGSGPVLPSDRRPNPEEAADEEQALGMGDLVKTAPPWLMSGVVHMLVLVALGLFYVASTKVEKAQIEVVPNPWADELGDPLGKDTMDYKSLTPTDSRILAISNLPAVDNPLSAPGKVDVGLTGTGPGYASSDVVASSIGNNPLGLREGSREANLTKYGGTKLTEAGVQMALEWLKRNQQGDGSWSLSGPFDGGVEPPEPAAATAMAMLAFQGTGNTHKRGKYQKEVLKAKDFLLARQMDNGTWRTDSGHHRMYVHGQCTIALCELYAMTQDPTLKKAAQSAADFCVKSQSNLGGWRYNPADQDADVSVTGWVLMGLQSAKLGKLEVPNTTFQRITKFLDDASTDGGVQYGYLAKTDAPTQSMTAEALLMREWLGWPRDNKNLQRGIEYLVAPERLPRWESWDDLTSRGRDVYFWYYATQAIHHYGGKEWDKWNEAIRKILPANQVKEGREKGSWDPRGDKWGQFGGRLYVTCMSTFILEVYYRHLPLYELKR